jgi:hemerythrin-like metal-binding protein
MAIEWNEKYRVGNDAIDAEHKELFNIASRFLNASDTGAQLAAALELRDYTSKHFRHEEALMHEIGYPLTATHLKLHTDLLSKLGEIEKKIELDDLNNSDIENFINYWFIKHMAAVDAPLVVYVKRYMTKT